MESKIQLLHPAGKNAKRMDTTKYNLFKDAILKVLTIKGALTHTEMLKMIMEDFTVNQIRFEGSVEWYMEGVKLDMEARNEIKRIEDSSPVKYAAGR